MKLEINDWKRNKKQGTCVPFGSGQVYINVDREELRASTSQTVATIHIHQKDGKHATFHISIQPNYGRPRVWLTGMKRNGLKDTDKCVSAHFVDWDKLDNKIHGKG